MAKTHGVALIEDPLKNLDKVKKKPWVHISGGTMDHLLACYYQNEETPELQKTWVKQPVELLAFYVDLFKDLPTYLVERYAKEAQKGMLAFSPTHAFVFKPGKPFIYSIMA